MAYAEKRGRTWRVRYKKIDGTWTSESGFETKEEALNWGRDQEGDIRRRLWIDPDQREVPFGAFATAWLEGARLAPNTEAKYRAYLEHHILPEWQDWPLIAIFNSHLEIQAWVNELHEELAEPTVASVVALFSTVLNAAVRARRIPANPCQGLRVTSGDYAAERQVATPVQLLRAAMRIHHTFGHAGFVLTLASGYTGARWSELVGLMPHEYDEVNKAIPVREPMREAGGHLAKAPKAKTPASKRWIQLPAFLNTLYAELLDQAGTGYVFAGPRGAALRRSNFCRRFWRPTWDGDPDSDQAWLKAPVLPGFTFREARHTHRTWLAEDAIPEVARAARLGHRMPGMANVYEHVTPQMKGHVLQALEQRWQASLRALKEGERHRLVAMVPHLADELYRLTDEKETSENQLATPVSQISPRAV